MKLISQFWRICSENVVASCPRWSISAIRDQTREQTPPAIRKIANYHHRFVARNPAYSARSLYHRAACKNLLSAAVREPFRFIEIRECYVSYNETSGQRLFHLRVVTLLRIRSVFCPKLEFIRFSRFPGITFFPRLFCRHGMRGASAC